MSIVSKDDYFHMSDANKEWRESYYFNFVSRDNKTSGFTTIGFLPNQEKAEFVFAFASEDKQILYFEEHKMSAKCQSDNLLTDNTLTYRLVKPMRTWRIEFLNESLDLQIQWNARFPPFDFGKGSETSWSSHFEQSGIAIGEAKLTDGTIIPIDGLSQRDKSWGPRDWHIEKWFALHAQFKKYAIGLRADTVKGLSRVSGGLSSARKHTMACHVNVEIEGSCKKPSSALTTIEFADGKVQTIKSNLVSPRSFVSFSRDFPGGSTELFEGMAIHKCLTTGENGTGLIEFLFTHREP